MQGRPEIVGIDARRTSSRQSGPYDTIIDVELPTSRSVRLNAARVYARRARSVAEGSKARLFAISVVVLFVGALAIEVVSGLLPLKLPTKTLADSGWGTATCIETSDLDDGSSPDVAVDAAGNAVAVWVQHDGIRQDTWSNKYVAGAWGTAELIETGTFGTGNPHVAMNSAGNAIAVWEQARGSSGWDVWSNRCVVGASWEGMQLVETDNSDSWRAEVAREWP